ncbi:M15 family metallopeptidase [Acidovorax radicis]|uniref:M15 family metallopeptidase n=1 Tax=Acidovorax radicis TaxID=758826 RepID=UPI001CFB641D|nr:M15 family metallopeptidase [Acidovorax radicis]UCV00057.1 D-Ala-D-Ala dipeptidase [Acidovorax radicis]
MPVISTTPHRRLFSRIAAASGCTRWSSVAAALVLAACAHSPQAAVQTNTGEPAGASIAAAAHNALGCRSESSARESLKNIAAELQAQGMALKTTCQADSGGLRVQVQVIDGVKASKVVRGPLADGHEVDMGTPSGAVLAGAAGRASGFSPDVQHNRLWLSALMARHQFDNLPDAWWHFAQRKPLAPDVAETDLAAR